jgi:hypothetical protein
MKYTLHSWQLGVVYSFVHLMEVFAYSIELCWRGY